MPRYIEVWQCYGEVAIYETCAKHDSGCVQYEGDLKRFLVDPEWPHESLDVSLGSFTSLEFPPPVLLKAKFTQSELWRHRPSSYHNPAMFKFLKEHGHVFPPC